MSLKFQSTDTCIEDARLVRALRAPVRQEILDAVEAEGACSVAELSARLDRAPDALYYHLRELLRLGLLIRVEPADAAPGMVVDVPCRPMRIRYRPDRPAQRKALGEVVGAMLRLAERDFVDGLASPQAVVDGPRRNTWAARIQARLHPTEVERLQEILQEAHALVASAAGRTADSGADTVSLSVVLSPAPRRHRRTGAGSAKGTP